MSADALNAALASPLYSGGRRALLLVLAWRANDLYGHCFWMSKSAMARQAGLTAKSVQRYLREFEAAGIIVLAGEEPGKNRTYHFMVAALQGGDAQTPRKKERHIKKRERHSSAPGAAPRTPNGAAPRPTFNKVTMRLPSVDDVRPAETTTFTKALAELDRTGRFASKTEAARHLMDLPSDEVDALAQGTAP